MDSLFAASLSFLLVDSASEALSLALAEIDSLADFAESDSEAASLFASLIASDWLLSTL